MGGAGRGERISAAKRLDRVLQRLHVGEPLGFGRGREVAAKLDRKRRDTDAVAVGKPRRPGKLWRRPDKRPKAMGTLPTETVAVTVLLAAAITDTVLEPKFAT